MTKQVLWQDYVTIAGVGGTTDTPAVSVPLHRAIDLMRSGAVQVRLNVTERVGGCRLVLATSVGRSGPFTVVAEVDLADLPVSRTFNIAAEPGVVSFALDDPPSLHTGAYGRFLFWSVVPESAPASDWRVTFQAFVTPTRSLTLLGPADADVVTVFQDWITVDMTLADPAGSFDVLQSSTLWRDTCQNSSVSLTVDARLMSGFELILEAADEAEGARVRWVEVGTVAAEGVTDYLLNRDNGVADTDLLRNALRWRLSNVASAVDRFANFRITMSAR